MNFQLSTVNCLEAHDVVAAVYVNGFAVYAGTRVGEQEGGGGAGLRRHRRCASGRALGLHFSMSPKPEMPQGG